MEVSHKNAGMVDHLEWVRLGAHRELSPRCAEPRYVSPQSQRAFLSQCHSPGGASLTAFGPRKPSPELRWWAVRDLRSRKPVPCQDLKHSLTRTQEVCWAHGFRKHFHKAAWLCVQDPHLIKRPTSSPGKEMKVINWCS